MQKRGTLVLRLVLELALSAVIIFSLLSISKTLGTQQFFAKQSIAEEGALVVQALRTVPGNVVLPLSIDESFVVRLEDKAVVVEDRITPRKASFLGSVKPAIVKNSKTLYFYKDGNDISISSTEPVVSKRECTSLRLDRSNLRIEAPPAVQGVAQALGYRCSHNVCAADANPKDTTLSISLGTEGVAASFPDEGNSDLACTILNGMLAHDPSIDTLIIPGDFSQSARFEVETAQLETMGTVVQELS